MLIALGFGFWGWSASENFGDSLYLSITAFLLSDTYEDSTGVWNWQIEVARWTALLAFLLGASKAIQVFFSDALLRAKAQLRKDHLLVVGDSSFAAAIVNTALLKKNRVNWLAANQDQNHQSSKHLFVQESGWSLEQAHLYGLTTAKVAAVAFDDDAKSIAVSRQLRLAVPDENKLQVFLSMNAPWLAMRIDELDDIRGIRVVSKPQASVRRIHRRHPPFLIAKNSGNKHIHSVIVGFGEWGEAVLLDSLLSCATNYLSKPQFTIIDPRAESIGKSLKIRYPELSSCADFTFIGKTLSGAENCLDEASILAIGESSPITTCYVCMPNESESLSAGLTLQTVSIRAGWVTGPIFVRLSTPGALPCVPAGSGQLTSAQLIPFGGLAELAEETGILTGDTDGLAKALHLSYQNAGLVDRVADVPWTELPEDKRDANRRVAMHFPAKLSSAGVDINEWLKTLDAKPDLNNLPKVASLVADDAALEALAELEHERWMIDRRINGWSFGSERDDRRKFHPDLVPYNQLSEQSKSYDREVIKTLSKVLTG
jgi:hypothetical protein